MLWNWARGYIEPYCSQALLQKTLVVVIIIRSNSPRQPATSWDTCQISKVTLTALTDRCKRQEQVRLSVLSDDLCQWWRCCTRGIGSSSKQQCLELTWQTAQTPFSACMSLCVCVCFDWSYWSYCLYCVDVWVCVGVHVLQRCGWVRIQWFKDWSGVKFTGLCLTHQFQGEK